MSTDAAEKTPSRNKVEGLTFRIFRANETASFVTEVEANAKKRAPQHPVAAAGLQRAGQYGKGAVVRVLFSSPTLHVSYAWFKSGYPLPRHSHDVDCFYQIIAGTLNVGTEVLGKGDGVFIPADVPYTFIPGEEGAEFLEIRPTNDFGTNHRGVTEEFWDRVVDIRKSRQDAWETEQQPYSLVPIK